MSASRTPKIIAVAGGKGGVGKTVFAVMLGICLAGFKRRTILIDLDFSDGNMNGYLKVPRAEKSLNKYFTGRSIHLTDLTQHTMFDKLDAITLQSENFIAETCKPWQKRRLFRELEQLKADYIILDLGAASSQLALDSFLMADVGILLSTNEMFSIVNTYSFIRSALLRSLKRQFYDTPDVLRVLDECGLLVDGKKIKPLHAIIDQMDQPTQEKFSTQQGSWQNFRPKVVLNFAQESATIDDFFLLGPVAKDLLNVDLDYWGHIRFDIDVQKAVRNKRPDKLLAPTGKASEDVVRLVVRNFIANEVRAEEQRTSMWLKKNVNILQMFDERDSHNCTSKCMLWNNCPTRTEGSVCSKMNVDVMKKAD